MFTYMVLKTAM